MGAVAGSIPHLVSRAKQSGIKMEKEELLNQLRQAIASGSLDSAELKQTISQAKQERQEYLRRTPERILHSFSTGEEKESHIKFRRNPETGEIVIHTADRFAHAVLQSQALRQEHDSGALKFHVGASSDKGLKEGWHYRISISGDDKKALARVYKSLQLLEENYPRFKEYGKEVEAPQPPPIEKPKPQPIKEETRKPVDLPPQENRWGWRKALAAVAATVATGLGTLLYHQGRNEEKPTPPAIVAPVDTPKQPDTMEVLGGLMNRFWEQNTSEFKPSADGSKRLRTAEDLKAEVIRLYGEDIKRWGSEYAAGEAKTRGGYKPTSLEDYLSYKLTEATHLDKSKTGWWHQVGGDHPTAHSKPQGRGGR
jgi:hypothetical protein